MRRILFTFLSILVAAFLAQSVHAASSHREFRLPPQAKPIAENVYLLGQATENDQRIEGVAIVHPKKANAKPGAGAAGKPASACYGYIASGARWRTTENYLVDPTNSRRMDEVSIRSNISNGLATWDDQVTFDIFGNEVAGTVDGVDTTSTDGKNEIMFGNVADTNAIGVTVVWYTIGSPKSRQIVEYDQMYDDSDYDWSVGDPADPAKMDFLNIATHEDGHAAGMADLYDVVCSEETEYGYGTEGETKKRDLHTGDIEGIKKLYK